MQRRRLIIATKLDLGMTKVKAIIQARMSSRRLPGKVLLPLGDDVVLPASFERS